MSQTTPIDQQPPQFLSYLAKPPVITEAQWAHHLALTCAFYLFHQSNIACPDATYPLDTFHRWQQSLLVTDELHTVTVSLALLVEELTRDNNSVLRGQKVCDDARNILAQQGYLTSPPPDLLSLPALTGHAFPGRHPPRSPPPPPPASCPSLPDPVLPVPAPPSPTHSSITDSIVPIANAVNVLQDILIPTRPVTPLPQLP
ncbi:hypothetical protein SERLA73DRAFT_80150 [Serpula lacrymans var. lacrymans S7.3]|uniref:Uncharacterized protein n=1 Tax=Serpula lacrymans var. lacrymans (strain S7.3) TaxID=936435 RepID=F8QIV9_SERL3|nr:hypothetical protein SERLA73DRAFT_80150 [Serpula lacrymans var. lacrymans S7.3]